MRRLSITCVVVAFTGITLPAWAQGYSLYQQGTCEMGQAGAGVAAPCNDGSAIFFNPAGLVTIRTPVLSIGATAVPIRGTFTNNTTGNISTLNASTSIVPTMYFAQPLGKRFVIGIGMFAPYGLATDWPATSEGRFIGYFSSVLARASIDECMNKINALYSGIPKVRPEPRFEPGGGIGSIRSATIVFRPTSCAEQFEMARSQLNPLGQLLDKADVAIKEALPISTIASEASSKEQRRLKQQRLKLVSAREFCAPSAP